MPPYASFVHFPRLKRGPYLSPHIPKKLSFFIQKRFHNLTACKISASLSFLSWIKNVMTFYRISELMLAKRKKKKSFHFKNERLTENLHAVRWHIL